MPPQWKFEPPMGAKVEEYTLTRQDVELAEVRKVPESF
jgi:hypothetical protein